MREEGGRQAGRQGEERSSAPLFREPRPSPGLLPFLSPESRLLSTPPFRSLLFPTPLSSLPSLVSRFPTSTLSPSGPPRPRFPRIHSPFVTPLHSSLCLDPEHPLSLRYPPSHFLSRPHSPPSTSLLPHLAHKGHHPDYPVRDKQPPCNPRPSLGDTRAARSGWRDNQPPCNARPSFQCAESKAAALQRPPPHGQAGDNQAGLGVNRG